MWKMGRRKWLAACTSVAILAPTWHSERAEAADSIASGIDLGLLRQPETLKKVSLYRNRMIMELRGTVEVREPLREGKKKETRSAEIEAKSTLDFEENFAIADAQSRINSSLRYFHEAKVDNTIVSSGNSLQLDQDLRQVVTNYQDNDLILYSPAGPLTPAEIDLLKMPCNTLALHELLPTKRVQLLEKWSVTPASLQRLLSLEAVHDSDITGMIKTQKGDLLDIEIRGELSGTAASVPTAIQIEGNIQVDLQGKSITWVALILKEKRQISQLEPGFDITARIRLVRKPLETAAHTADLSLTKPSAEKLPGLLMQRIESARGRYQMLADRNWKVIHDNGQSAILRMIEADRVVCQCNIHQLPKLDAGQQVTLEAYQEEIRKSLEKNFDSFASSEERVSEAGLRILQITALGQTADLPVQWIFYYLSDDNGRRLSMVFTVGGELVDKLAGTDSQMAGSLRFLELPTESNKEPTPASPPAAEVSARPQSEKTTGVK